MLVWSWNRGVQCNVLSCHVLGSWGFDRPYGSTSVVSLRTSMLLHQVIYLVVLGVSPQINPAKRVCATPAPSSANSPSTVADPCQHKQPCALSSKHTPPAIGKPVCKLSSFFEYFLVICVDGVWNRGTKSMNFYFDAGPIYYVLFTQR